MLKIANYVRAQSLEEAYALCQKNTNLILGGMLWLKMQNRSVNTVIDLCDLGLDTIEDAGDSYSIGAMVSLRALETHPGIAALTGGAMAEALKHIVGVQFRNTATVGGSLFGRFGFSDVLTLFLVLGARVELYHGGMMDIRDFAALPLTTRDVLVRVILPKAQGKTVYLSQRNTATDFPVLTCALSVLDGRVRCAVGARPARAVLMEEPLDEEITAQRAADLGQRISEALSFGSNSRASAAYRKKICSVLVRRALMQTTEV